MISLLLAALLVKIRIVTWDKSVFLEREKIPHHFRQAFWYGKGVRYHQIFFLKIGTLEDFEKTYVLYVAMAEKTLLSGQKWFLR